MFSCRTRGFCPSCHAKRLEEWGEWMKEGLLLDVPHRQVVFTIPRMLRIFFKYNRRLLGELCRSALRSMSCYIEVVTGSKLMLGIIASIQTFGNKINFHPRLHFLVTEGGVDKAGVFHKISRIDEFIARVTSHIPDKCWAEMIRKVYEVDPMVCPQCGATMKVIAFLTDGSIFCANTWCSGGIALGKSCRMRGEHRDRRVPDDRLTRKSGVRRGNQITPLVGYPAASPILLNPPLPACTSR